MLPNNNISALVLRELQEYDIALYKEWLYKPHVAKWYHHPEDWLEEVEKRHAEYNWLYHFMAENAGRPVGFCQYYLYVNGEETWHGTIEKEGTYSIDYMIGESAYLKQGIGTCMVKALVEKIRHIPGAKRIIVQPEPENTASCHTLLACGFVFDAENTLYCLELC